MAGETMNPVADEQEMLTLLYRRIKSREVRQAFYDNFGDYNHWRLYLQWVYCESIKNKYTFLAKLIESENKGISWKHKSFSKSQRALDRLPDANKFNPIYNAMMRMLQTNKHTFLGGQKI